ncbi:MAG: sensor histidine kinase [Limisphaerales bacterium]
MNRRFRVLIVDDNIAMARGLAVLLEPHYEVREVHNGRDALQQAESFRPDLILLDIELPDTNGFEVCRKLRAHPQLKEMLIVHISASRAGREDQLAGLETGAHAFITLPTSNRELLARINAMMRVKEVEHALRESERRYRSLAEALPNLVWTCNAQGECEYLSQQWIDYTGVAPDEHKGYRWINALHPDDRDRAYALWQKTLAGECHYDLEYRLRGSDGSYRWFKTRAVPSRNEEGTIVQWFGTCTDITELMEARETLRENQAELGRRVQQRTSELQETVRELENFSYTIAHDLRAPLRAMNSFSAILLEEHAHELSGDGKDYLSRIARASKRFDQMLTDLLWYSQLNLLRVQIKEIPVRETIFQAIKLLAAEIKRTQAEVTVEEEEIPAVVLAEKSMLLVVLQQLISNSMKFNQAGAPRIAIGAQAQGGQIRIFVRDNGIGIDQRHHERIFKIFEKLDAATGNRGTGIGLAVAKKCVERMNGKLNLESSPGKGSCFWVELPAAK